MIEAALAGFTLQQRLLGAALAIAVWLLPAGATWLYMKGDARAQYALGMASCEKTTAQATAAALDRFHVEQAALSERARNDTAELQAALVAARHQAAALSQELAAYAAAHPLPADCRGDDGRVRLYNEARRGPLTRP